MLKVSIGKVLFPSVNYKEEGDNVFEGNLTSKMSQSQLYMRLQF